MRTSPALRYPKSLWSYNPIPGNCVLYLPLWSPGLSGPVFKSPDSFGHTATVTGASCVWVANGRSFDGTDDTITVPNHAAFNFGASTDFTLMGWGYGTDSNDYMIFKGDVGAANAHFSMLLETNGEVRGWIDDGTTSVSVDGTTDARNAWHLYAATFNRDGNLTVYFDGVSEGTPASIAGVGDIDATEDLMISGRLNSGIQDGEWAGTIGEVWIYNGVLTAGEILHNYNCTRWRYNPGNPGNGGGGGGGGGSATEEQTESNDNIAIKGVNAPTCGQRLTIPNRTVTKLAFYIRREGNPTGDVTLTIRKVSDKSLILSKVWGNAADVPTDLTWLEVTFDTPIAVNEEVRILIETSGYNDDNHLVSRMQLSDVKADEMWTRGSVASPVDMATWDFVYKYTYSLT